MQYTSLEERIKRFLSSCESASEETLRRHAGIPPRGKSAFSALLSRLAAAGELEKHGNVYSLPRPVFIEGVLWGNERGFAFFTPTPSPTQSENGENTPTNGQESSAKQTPPQENKNGKKDVFIPAKYLNGAMHKDRVLIRLLPKSRDRRRGEEESQTGEVVKILQRGYEEIVGAFYKDKRGGRLLPDEREYFSEIYIPLASCKHVKNGVKAVAKILSYARGRCPEGEITEVLGDDDDFFAEETSIIRTYSLRETFPEEAEKEAELVSAEPIALAAARKAPAANTMRKTDKAEALRRDLREEFFVTIDGADTRDIDDGVSVQKQGENYLLSVHIADVSHYTAQGGALDKEAFKRGTSVYFPDRVLPMLPKALSNGCCSLNEGEERYAITCRMLIAGNAAGEKAGETLTYEIFPSLVKSTYRLTYDEVDCMLSAEDESESTREKYPLLQPTLPLMKELTELLKAKRLKAGEVDLALQERRIYYDAAKDEIEIPPFKPSFSRGIVESFMIAANETVANFLSSRSAPCLYRVHERPTEEKAAALKSFARLLGFAPRFSPEEVSPQEYAALLNEAKGSPKEDVLKKVLLRSMQKARYEAKNLGHFALVSPCYCHFTSPIRRYPDLFVHRAIKAALVNDEKSISSLQEIAEETAKKCSEAERTADDCERAVDDLYAAVYTADYIGQCFEATVSGVTERGFFAELNNGIEGFVPLDSLRGYYVFLPEEFALKGGGKKYALGDKTTVKVTDVNFYTRKITFAAVDTKEAAKTDTAKNALETSEENAIDKLLKEIR